MGIESAAGGAGGLMDVSATPVATEGLASAAKPAGGALDALKSGADTAKENAELLGQYGDIAEQAENAVAELGQGGTSLVTPAETETASTGHAPSEEPKRKGGIGSTIAKVGGSAAVGTAGAQALVWLMLLNYLKMFLAMGQAILTNLWAALMALVANGVNAVATGFIVAGTFLANLFGISAIAGAIASAGTAIAVLFAVVGLVFSTLFGGGGAAAQGGTIADCRTGEAQQAALVGGDATGVASTQMQNAKTIYSVLAAWGMPRDNIAGILGNWEAESGIDPTSVQNSGGQAYVMTPDKQTDAAVTSNGIGLGQWTGGRNTALRTFATSANQNWWTVSTQLSFMLSPAEGGNADVVRDMIANDKGSPSAAALYFHSEWERSADTEAMAQRRAVNAEKWYALFAGWTVNQQLADSLLAQAGTTIAAANQNQVDAAKSSCRGLNTQNVLIQDGGMDQARAQQLIDLYNQEGDAFLDGRYGQNGGPGSCGDNHAENCVSFSTYFLNKYTTFQTYPRGDGIDTARTVSRETGIPLQSTPVAYSVASGPGSTDAGHTFIVLGVQGDQVIVGEAAWCASMGRVTTRSASQLTQAGWVFVPLNGMMLPAGQVKTS
ncbi:MAG TPA: phage tail tip lysozyme [Candidatus Lumbricidophila sp.]|nr:phage tail tip lysozyme [Candidatus Lumbricidophila sp.]